MTILQHHGPPHLLSNHCHFVLQVRIRHSNLGHKNNTLVHYYTSRNHDMILTTFFNFSTSIYLILLASSFGFRNVAACLACLAEIRKLRYLIYNSLLRFHLLFSILPQQIELTSSFFTHRSLQNWDRRFVAACIPHDDHHYLRNTSSSEPEASCPPVVFFPSVQARV